MVAKITIEQTACEWGVPVNAEESERLHDAYEMRVVTTLATMFPHAEIDHFVQRRASGGLDYVRAYDADGEPDERTEGLVRGVLGEAWVHTCGITAMSLASDIASIRELARQDIVDGTDDSFARNGDSLDAIYRWYDSAAQSGDTDLVAVIDRLGERRATEVYEAARGHQRAKFSYVYVPKKFDP